MQQHGLPVMLLPALFFSLKTDQLIVCVSHFTFYPQCDLLSICH